MECKILLIDTLPEITLLKESLSCTSLPFNLIFFSSFHEAVLAIREEKPDLFMIGSEILIKHNFDTSSLRRTVPIVILCEGYGFNILLKECPKDMLVLSRPFDLEGIPAMFEAAYQFLKLCKEKEHVFPKDK